jgi:outer membrane protein assembly factor BamB
LRHCREVASGALRRAPEAVAAPPLRKPPPREQRPLHAAGRVRRLVYREAWRERLPAGPSCLWLFGREGALAALAAGEVTGYDLDSGRPLWGFPCTGPRAAARAATGADLFVLGPEALVRLEPASGQVRWRRKMSGGDHCVTGSRPPSPAGAGPLAALYPLPGGLLVSSRGALALVEDGGRAVWRARLEEAPRSALLHESALLLALPGGVFAALDLHTGRALWRKRIGARAGAPAVAGGRLVVAAERGSGAPRLLALDPQSGEQAWQAELPAASAPPAALAFGDSVALSTAAGVSSHRASDGGRRFLLALPWGSPAQLAAADELDEQRGPFLLAAGPGGALALIDGAGAVAWRLEGEGLAPPSPPQLVRGVAIAAASGLSLCDALEGVPVAHLGGQKPPSLWASAPDLTMAICDGAELAVHRLATHLSLV